MPRLVGTLGLLVCWLTLSVASARADAPSAPLPNTPPDVELAKAHFRTGEIYYQRQRFPDAAREFEEAYRLSGRAELLYNMGKSYDGASDTAKALHAYRRFIAALPASPDRKEVDNRISVLEQTVGRLEITATVDGSIVTLNGEKLGTTPLLPAIVDVNPGKHSIEIAAEGYSTYRRTLTIGRGQRLDVRAEMASLVTVKFVEVERKTPVYKKWWLWTTVVGVVVIAGGVTAGVLLSKKNGPSEGLVLPGVQ